MKIIWNINNNVAILVIQLKLKCIKLELVKRHLKEKNYNENMFHNVPLGKSTASSRLYT